MKELTITNSERKAIVNDWNFERLSSFKWRSHPQSKSISRQYSRACTKEELPLGYANKRRTFSVSLASEVMNQIGTLFDHKDRDTFNNLETNLRVATRVQNNQNRGKKSDSVSKYKGVSIDRTRNKWAARIKHEDKYLHIGYFDNELNAVKAYNEAAIKYHGEFACLNKI